MSQTSQQALSQDNLAQALREYGTKGVAGTSALASCLRPLLEALNWSGDERDVAESFPHFVDDIDIVDLRNTFLALGFESHPQLVTLNDLDERLLPCLFEKTDGKTAFAVLRRTEKGFLIWQDNKEELLPFSETNINGTGYFFTKHDKSGTALDNEVLGWFGTVLGKFKSTVRMLLTVSLFTNILAIIFPLIIMFIYDKVIGARSTETLPFILFGVVIVLTFDLSLRFIRSRIVGFIAGRLDYLIGTATFEKILTLPPAYTERAAVSAQLSRIKEFETLRDFFTGPLAMTLIELPFTLLTLGIIMAIAGPLALVPIITLVGFAALTFLLLPKVKEKNRSAGHLGTKRDDLLVESLMNLRHIKDMGAEDVWLNRYRMASAKSAYAQHQSEFYTAIMDASSHALTMVSGIIILVVGTFAVLNQDMSIGALIATMILAWRVLSPIQTCFLAYSKLDQIKKSLAQLNNLMKLKSEGTDGKSSLLKETIAGDVVFNRVSFRYSSDSDPALLGASFRIKEGSLVTVIGANSSGKSTVVKLISGLYQPQGGAVTIGGLDLRQIDPLELRQKLAYVPQIPRIFYGTIAQNLRLSDPLASDEDLRRAAEQTDLLNTIEQLPEGFNTRIGNGHIEELAPGFLQRLSIARALLRPSAILLLDEPAASLDNEGDQVLMDLLESLKGQRTIIMVSHRPSHIRMSDSVIVFNRGIVEFHGAPEEALNVAQSLSEERKMSDDA